MGQVPIPLYAQLLLEDQEKIVQMYLNGSTEKELGALFGLPYRSVGKLIAKHGVKRDRSATASLKMKSKLDDPAIVDEIRELRKSHSLEEIAAQYNSSISSVDRLCRKYDILPPENFAELQSERLKVAWTEEKRQQAAETSKANTTPILRRELAKGSKELWLDPEYRAKQMEKKSRG